jgi:hypothetical protein
MLSSMNERKRKRGRPRGVYVAIECDQLRVPRHIYAALKRLALHERRTMSDLAAELLGDALARRVGLVSSS